MFLTHYHKLSSSNIKHHCCYSFPAQIIGLTASPGVGKGGNLSTAIAHVKSLCDILDAERICTVKKYEEELRYFINEPIHGEQMW